MTAIYDCYIARLICGFVFIHMPDSTEVRYFGYSQFPLNSRSQILMTEIWDLENFDDASVAHRNKEENKSRHWS